MDNSNPVNSSLILSPDYQQNLYLIDSALQEVGALPAVRAEVLPDIFDTQLRALIDAVPLE